MIFLGRRMWIKIWIEKSDYIEVYMAFGRVWERSQKQAAKHAPSGVQRQSLISGRINLRILKQL